MPQIHIVCRGNLRHRVVAYDATFLLFLPHLRSFPRFLDAAEAHDYCTKLNARAIAADQSKAIALSQ
jgi:hypothetical protein